MFRELLAFRLSQKKDLENMKKPCVEGERLEMVDLTIFRME